MRHTGPNCVWVEAARRWASASTASLWLDLSGVGLSDGDENLDISRFYDAYLVDEVALAIDALHPLRGFRRFVAVGLCVGAYCAFHASPRWRGVGRCGFWPRLAREYLAEAHPP